MQECFRSAHPKEERAVTNTTESRNPRTLNLDELGTEEFLTVMNDEDRRVPAAVAEALPEIALAVDLIAERIAALAGTAEGTIQVVSQKSKLPAYPLTIKDGLAHCDALTTTMAAFGKAVRVSIDRATELGDADTADLFTEISRETDKNLWFVEAHLQAER